DGQPLVLDVAAPMVFTSPIFLFLFLPSVLAVHFTLRRRGRNVWLLLASLVFYAWGEPDFLPVMLVSIVANFVFGIFIDRALRGLGAAGRRSHDHRWRFRLGRPSIHRRFREEGPDREPAGRAGGCDLRAFAGTLERPALVARRDLLHAPDILRFLGVLGHGDRTRAYVRISIHREFRLSPRVDVGSGILAALAH